MRSNRSAISVRRRLLRAMTTSAVALAAFFLMVAALAWTFEPAAAQGNGAGTLTLSTVPEFSVCVALPDVVAQPGLTNTIVSSANGGEIRLRATVEDYFDGIEIDSSQWITGTAYTNAYTDQVPIIANGVLTLYGSYLRSMEVFSATTPTRFFEASAQLADSRRPSNVDIGYYRSLPPLQVPSGDESSIRLFIAQPAFSSENDSLLYVRSRDGTIDPYVDTMVYNWGSEADDQRIGMAQYRNYRVEWDASETWYLVDGAAIAVDTGDDPLPHTGVSTRTTYVFLYNQDPLDPASETFSNTTPLLIDWVRAGVYPTTGDFVSCIQDAGQVVNWTQATITATLPANTGAQLATRTSVDGVVWSAWADATGSVISGTATLTPASPSGRYLQYRLTLTSSDPLESPEVGALTFSHFGPASLVVAPAATTLDPAASQQFTATVRDLNNAVIDGAPITWTVGSGGVINGSGLFTAGLPAGVFTDTVQATASNGISNTASVTVLDLPPIADAGGPYSGTEGQAVNLSASASDPNGGPIIAYDWDLDNDGQFDDATGATPSASWGDEGVYIIGVRATDSGNLTGTATTTVTISNVTPQITSVTNSGPVRRTQPVTVTVTATDVPADALTYSFDWMSDGTYDITDQAGNSAATSYASTGVYTATVRVRDGDGGEATATTVITVTPQLLSATATNSGPVRRSQPVTVTVSAGQELSDPLTYSFDWTSDGTYDITDQAGNSAATSYASTGVYTATVRVRDADGGEATATTVITVTPQLLSATATNSGPVRRSQPVTVTVSAAQELSDPLTYSFDWTSDGTYDITDQAGNSAATSYASTGVYTATVRVRDADGGETTATTVITVTPQLLSATATNSSPVRRGQPVTVTVSAGQELSDPLTYGFDFDNNGIFEVVQAGSSAATSYAATGVKPVNFGVADSDNGIVTGATTITVTPQILTIVGVSNSGPVLRNQPVTVIVTATQELSDALTYSFDWENDGVYDVVDQPGNSATTSYPTVGDRTVRVRVRDGDGGEISGTTTVQVGAQIIQITAVTSNAPVRRNQPVTVTVSAVQQLSDVLLYSFDWNNDGTYDVVDQTASSAATSYAVTGNKTIRVRVHDQQNSEASQTATVQVVPQNLSATATNNGPVRRGQSVQVTVSAVQELSDVLLYSFDWNDDGNYEIVNQTANSASISYPATGSKTVRVRVVDADGGVVTATTVITVTPQNLSATATNNGPVRRGQSVQVTVSAVQELSDALSYSFDWNDDGNYEIVNQTANSASISYPATGSKTVRVRVVDADGGVATGVTTITVTPQTLMLVAVTNSGPVQVGASVQVTVEVTQELGDALRYSFDWDNNGVYEIENQPANSATTSYAEAGLKVAAVRVIDADGGVAIGTTAIEVTTVEGGGGVERVYMPIINR